MKRDLQWLQWIGAFGCQEKNSVAFCRVQKAVSQTQPTWILVYFSLSQPTTAYLKVRQRIKLYEHNCHLVAANISAKKL